MKTIKHLLADKGDVVYSAGLNESVYDAIRRMAEHNIGALLVLGPDGRLIGMITERDYTRKVILKGKSSKDTPISEIMTAPVMCGSPEQSLEEVMALMTDKRIRHVPVVVENSVVGLVSIGDLVKAIIADQKFIIEQLEHYIAG
jgi:CBS domain-containing protein